MPTALRFTDHEGFHRHAMAMTALGGMAGLWHDVATRYSPVALPPVGLALVAGGVFFGAAPAARRSTVSFWVCLCAILAFTGLGSTWAMARGDDWSLLGSFVLPLGLALGTLVTSPSVSRAWAFVAGLAAVGLGAFVAWRTVSFTAVPSAIVGTMSGATFGLLASTVLLARHVRLERDAVWERWNELGPRLSGEPKELLARAMELWDRVRHSLPAGDASRSALEESTLGMMTVARRWQTIETEGAGASVTELAERMAAIDAKLAIVKDPVARQQYVHTQEALAAQHAAVSDIATSRERIVSRLHHTLAAMERLRLAVLHHRSVDASRVSAEVAPLLEDLKDLGADLDLTSHALGEIEAQA